MLDRCLQDSRMHAHLRTRAGCIQPLIHSADNGRTAGSDVMCSLSLSRLLPTVVSSVSRDPQPPGHFSFSFAVLSLISVLILPLSVLVVCTNTDPLPSVSLIAQRDYPYLDHPPFDL
ncbi:hypothetical protein BCR44DRAFT_1431860 [Catenaria anguillulae PL171]|uniref:Uncharacterized protein n=1 Tax=Catenaria anguillulae PL171 TaxID=765915 RepID=A0A1Y2HQI8_9FUNG|nr:hypothetical protein BCR44DRAFT_1431860 [Catenaria anguillulae PL171]